MEVGFYGTVVLGVPNITLIQWRTRFTEYFEISINITGIFFMLLLHLPANRLRTLRIIKCVIAVAEFTKRN